MPYVTASYRTCLGGWCLRACQGATWRRRHGSWSRRRARRSVPGLWRNSRLHRGLGDTDKWRYDRQRLLWSEGSTWWCSLYLGVSTFLINTAAYFASSFGSIGEPCSLSQRTSLSRPPEHAQCINKRPLSSDVVKILNKMKIRKHRAPCISMF